MNHRVSIVDARDDDRCYAGHGDRLVGPFDDAAKAAGAINRAAAGVAILYAGMDITVDDAMDETFGTNDLDERQHLSDQYYLSALNLLDGAEDRILDRMMEDDEELERCQEWVCSVCQDEWTGPSSECFNCENAAREAAEAEETLPA